MLIWGAGKHELNEVDDETELCIKKGRLPRAYIISFQKGFFPALQKSIRSRMSEVRRKRRYQPKMLPWSHQHKKVEDSTELGIEKEEIIELILFPPIKAEPDESTSNEVQPKDNVHL
jgi:hypothetical protein